jgi:hypothetical protein
MNATVIAACITAVVTIIGWVIVRLKDINANRLKIHQDFVMKQIEELYGPLYNLVLQINNFWDIEQNLLNRENDKSKQDKVRVYFREHYYYPLHLEVRLLLKNKTHLLQNQTMPKSFDTYLKHSTQETVQIDIWNNLNISTIDVAGIPWPDEFETDIKSTLGILMKNYDKLLPDMNTKNRTPETPDTPVSL